MKSKSKVPADSVSGEDQLPGSQATTFFLSPQEGRGRSFPGLLTGAPISLMGAPPWGPNHSLKAHPPPDALISGMSFQHRNSEGQILRESVSAPSPDRGVGLRKASVCPEFCPRNAPGLCHGRCQRPWQILSSEFGSEFLKLSSEVRRTTETQRNPAIRRCLDLPGFEAGDCRSRGTSAHLTAPGRLAAHPRRGPCPAARHSLGRWPHRVPALPPATGSTA